MVSEKSWGSKLGLLGKQWKDTETRNWREPVGEPEFRVLNRCPYTELHKCLHFILNKIGRCCILVFPCSAGNQTQGFVHTRQVLELGVLSSTQLLQGLNNYVYFIVPVLDVVFSSAFFLDLRFLFFFLTMPSVRKMYCLTCRY